MHPLQFVYCIRLDVSLVTYRNKHADKSLTAIFSHFFKLMESMRCIGVLGLRILYQILLLMRSMLGLTII
jgi:hypothetical protein